jgi:hypothetical protein
MSEQSPGLGSPRARVTRLRSLRSDMRARDHGPRLALVAPYAALVDDLASLIVSGRLVQLN